MLSLALSSVRHRPGRFAATLLAAFLGAAIIMLFNSLHDTAVGAGVDPASAESLHLTGGVVGGYGTLLVFFAIASTLTVNVRQRGEEMGLLRRAGATPGQIRLMVVAEAAIVGVVGSALAVWPAMLAGRALVDRFQETGQVAGGVAHAFGPLAYGVGCGVTLLSSVGAASLAVRRAARAAAGMRRRGRAELAGGALALLAGAGGISATFALKATDSALMAAPAYGAVLLAVGFGVFSPYLLRVVIGPSERLLSRVFGAGGHLAVLNTRQRTARLSEVLMPLVVFTGLATVTLYLQAVESDAIRAAGLTRSVEDKNLETLNFTVVGIIAGFACLMLINSLVAATCYRRREFGQQRLAGATPGQVLAMVGCEGLLMTVTGVLFGTLAGVAGIVAFSAVRTGSVRPGQGPGIWLGIVALAAAATLLTGLGTASRQVRVPAVDAVATA
ncbi:FtsX-like permease family protein [Couchioplanes azureus]|uniref:FtsX-like permease family protein n=1 Tax=Couchioplanes caeruleus TaxID=56438 RepID=UPI0016711CE0|nr:FtsX-like permease family protein [Couchioplanes caeruleus]GGQ76043.1 transporter [Couchioplanes caeruleus subsp. azureus]